MSHFSALVMDDYVYLIPMQNHTRPLDKNVMVKLDCSQARRTINEYLSLVNAELILHNIIQMDNLFPMTF